MDNAYLDNLPPVNEPTPESNPKPTSDAPILPAMASETPASAPTAPVFPDAAVKNMSPRPEKAAGKKTSAFLLGILVVILVAAGIVTSLVYWQAPTSPLVRTVIGVLPFPALVINGQIITIADYLGEYDALNNYFSKAEDVERPVEEELQNNIIETIVNKTLLEQLAAKYEVSVSPEDIDKGLEDLAEMSGGEEALTQQVTDNFGWSLDQFKNKVINSLVLANKMTEFVYSSADLQADKHARAEEAMARLIAGDDFGVVAAEMSDDPSAKANGDLGYIKQSEMVEPWASAVAELKKGERTDIIDTAGRYLIFQVTDRITKKEDEEFKLLVISVRKKTLDEIVQDYLRNSQVRRFILRQV